MVQGPVTRLQNRTSPNRKLQEKEIWVGRFSGASIYYFATLMTDVDVELLTGTSGSRLKPNLTPSQTRNNSCGNVGSETSGTSSLNFRDLFFLFKTFFGSFISVSIRVLSTPCWWFGWCCFNLAYELTYLSVILQLRPSPIIESNNLNI